MIGYNKRATRVPLDDARALGAKFTRATASTAASVAQKLPLPRERETLEAECVKKLEKEKLYVKHIIANNHIYCLRSYLFCRFQF